MARAVYGFVVFTLVVVAVLASLLVSNRMNRLTDAALDSAVRVRTEAAAQTLARTLHSDWGDLKQLADMVGTYPENAIGALMVGLRGDGARISWVGFADTSGIVRVASDGLLEGQDVSARPWFRNGLQGGFAGDVHEAALLADLLPAPPDGSPIRFIDLALPVRNKAGDVTGVLGMHIDATWMQTLMTETASALHLSLFLVSANGALSLATDGADPTSANLWVLRAAQVGVANAGRETWPDGREYFSSLVPGVTYRDLPHFGWRLVGRLEGSSFSVALEGALNAVGLIAAAAIALMTASTALFVHLFIRPIERLARTATRIADGVDDFPPEGGNTREMANLSAALVRLQEQRDGQA
ncbi:cache and HAMP domain-containing protein [Aestuariicoccus sp. KMU-90]|uniref:Cache and HAMP domain-containing protein n=1 Tax=Thetidibacter halocola TaxID=2827239 RepID=A0A8J7WF71_9RHOB|nr:cache and HAMP domain-containing protein [Thetidibacter halocola]